MEEILEACNVNQMGRWKEIIQVCQKCRLSNKAYCEHREIELFEADECSLKVAVRPKPQLSALKSAQVLLKGSHHVPVLAALLSIILQRVRTALWLFAPLFFSTVFDKIPYRKGRVKSYAQISLQSL